MGAVIYKMVVLAVLFCGGYLLLHYGMAVDQKLSLFIGFAVLPAITFVVWFISYRGKKFR